MTPELQVALNLPFAEAERFFQQKLNIPTTRWDDLWHEQHAKGFMVAGAAKADIVTDFRTAVEKAIEKGTTLEEFRKDFDNIVKKHGWSYNGGRNWRSEVIYSTNVRQAYNAGRWAQLTDKDQLRVLPYLTYKHGDSRSPRPLHLQWNGTTLPPDDSWWDTHAPQNGWGCRCRVYGSTKKEYEAAKVGGKGEAPKSEIDPKTGEPVGIDKGFGYNVGQAQNLDAHAALGEKMALAWPSAIRAAAEKEILPGLMLNDRFQAWADGIMANKTPGGAIKTSGQEICVGYMTEKIIVGLTELAVVPQTSALSITDNEWLHLQHLAHDRKPVETRKTENILTMNEARNLPNLIENKLAALWDSDGKALVYVFAAERDARRGKIVVRVNFNVKGRISNQIRSGGFVSEKNLRQANYVVLEGGI